MSGNESTCQAGDMDSVPGFGNIPLEKEMAIHSSILAWEIPWTEESGWHSPPGHKESDMNERLDNSRSFCATVHN